MVLSDMLPLSRPSEKGEIHGGDFSRLRLSHGILGSMITVIPKPTPPLQASGNTFASYPPCSFKPSMQTIQ